MQRKPRASTGRNRLKGRKEDPPLVRLSKTLSYALRHGAVDLQLPIDAAGFVPLDAIVQLPMLKQHQFTRQDVLEVVQTNDKQRFTICEKDGDEYIRANQGHTLQHVQDDALLTRMTDPSSISKCIHGTYRKFWSSILENGLCRMARNHIHFTSQEVVGGDVISGMRTTCDVLLYIDHAQAMRDGIEFYRSSNNVILSPGIGENGVIPRQYFERAIVRATGEILYERAQTQTKEKQNQ